MTYDPDTGWIRCDVCGTERPKRTYCTYRRPLSSQLHHCCNTCAAAGAYWCTACEDVHAGQDKCPQQQMESEVDHDLQP